jgi:hypothetical protein
MSASLHYTPVRELHNYRDQYAPSFKPYTSSATYPGAETNKYKPHATSFAARAGEHGGSFYNHRPNEVGWTSGPYSGHDARHSGFNPGSHFFNSGYHQNPESNIELRRPFCGMTQSRTQKVRLGRACYCSDLILDLILDLPVLATSGIHASHAHTAQVQPIHFFQHSLEILSFLLFARNNHEFTPSLQEEDKLGVSHTLPVLVPNQLSFSTLFLPTGLILKEVSAHFLSALC